jgi:pimeloyl-ACP methyl ester carboxylesterase
MALVISRLLLLIAATVLLSARLSAAHAAIAWHDCPAGSVAASVGGFVCATVNVPLDYGAPGGATITLALVKHPATDLSHRISTLFTNPGGPAGQGTVQIPAWIDFFPAIVKARFDLVSWDPRGVGSSTAVQCFSSSQAEDDFLDGNADFPATVAAEPGYAAVWARFGQRCAERNGELLKHVSTADTARDLDRLRELLGEPKLTYIGLSYGTILGATYANLFPDRVRALVLDGNIAPSAWRATPPADPSQSISQRIGTAAWTSKTLDEFLTLCGRVSTARCAFSAGSPEATHAKYLALLARLRQGPIYLGAKTETYTKIVGQLSEALLLAFPHPNEHVPSSSVPGWVGFSKGLEALWQARTAAPAKPAPAGAADSAPASYAGPEQALAIECGDVPAPPAAAFPALAAIAEKREGPIARGIVWGDAACATWPVRQAADVYLGPWNRQTAGTILVVGNTTDPSTPYQNSLGMASMLARARLLTVHGVGHTALLNPSACANEAIASYLTEEKLPPKGKVCEQDASPL